MGRYLNKRNVILVALLLTLTAGAYAYFSAPGSGTGEATVGAAMDIELSSEVAGPLYPGGADEPVVIHIHNPGSGNEHLGSFILGTVRDQYNPDTDSTCLGEWFEVDAAAYEKTLAPDATDTATTSMRMLESGSVQDACEGLTMTIDWTTSAEASSAGAGSGSDSFGNTSVSVVDPAGGPVVITHQSPSFSPSGYTLSGVEYDITAPASTTSEPLVLTFTDNDATPPVQVFVGGVLVPDCTGAPGVADPNPCVSARSGQTVTVLSSHASLWDTASVDVTPPSDFICPLDQQLLADFRTVMEWPADEELAVYCNSIVSESDPDSLLWGAYGWPSSELEHQLRADIWQASNSNLPEDLCSYDDVGTGIADTTGWQTTHVDAAHNVTYCASTQAMADAITNSDFPEQFGTPPFILSPTVAAYQQTTATSPPDPTIDSNPDDPTNATSADFSFSDSESGVSFVCALDSDTFTACDSPKSYTSLSAGSHTFKVKAVDAATNLSSATTFTWTIDLTPAADPSIDSNPNDPTNATSADFSFSDSESGVSFVCALDSDTFTACDSPKSYAGPLSAGSHTFKVKAKDAAANLSDEISFTWTVDTTAPVAAFTATPADPSSSSSAHFEFNSSEPTEVVTFRCKLDVGSYSSCSSPVDLSSLADGSHTFYVLAKDAATNEQATATSYTWTISTAFLLTVSKSGAGSGTVTSSPAGISCGSNCSADYEDGAVVTLTASAAFGSDFAGWSGACSGDTSCQVTMSQARAVTATFTAIEEITEDGTMWRDSTDLSIMDNDFDPNTGEIIGPAPQAPAIAIVDSGVDGSLEDFGSRLVASVDSAGNNVSGDPLGHGTLLAGIAAGSFINFPGAAQNAPIVSVRAVDANGVSTKSDVIAAANWILAHKDDYNIKVAVFPMNTATATTFRFDALDQAVESLWFNGIVVVTAVGNHGTGSPVSMSYAPANDPFVITAGGLDQQQDSDPSDDTVPSWSAYGHTMDGFAKPDVAAPGRYMFGPISNGSALAAQAPNRVYDYGSGPGYMRMSDSSFSAAVIAGAAAQILARHPALTPGQVKGTLMLAANYLPEVDYPTITGAAGYGEIDAGVASTIEDPPNPNENLDSFVSSQTFDQAAWKSTVDADSSWCPSTWTCDYYDFWSSSAYTSGGLTSAPSGSAMRSVIHWAP